MIHSISYRSYIVNTQLRCLEAAGALGKWVWKSRRRSLQRVFGSTALARRVYSAEISKSLITLAKRGSSDREVAPFKISQFFNTTSLAIHNLVARSYV